MLSGSAEFSPFGARERFVAAVIRIALRILLKPALSPRVPIAARGRA